MPTLPFTSNDDLMATLTPRVLDLIETTRRKEPGSINEAARVVDRDVKNVFEELNRLAQLGIIFFEEEGQRNSQPKAVFDRSIDLYHSRRRHRPDVLGYSFADIDNTDLTEIGH